MEKFNKDTDALRSRATLNATGGKYNLEDWIIQSIPPLEGLNVLDLGCGTGKQIFRLAPLITDKGHILGLDISSDAVKAVKEQAETLKMGFVDAAQVGHDESLKYLDGKHFDLIISSYSINYATNPVALIKGFPSILNEHGTVFLCGPGEGSNQEMDAIISRFDPQGVHPIENFLSTEDIETAGESFAKTEVSYLNNKVSFDSEDAVMAWWENHNSYVPAIASEVREYLHEHFKKHPVFELTKNVLGIRFDA